MHITVEYVDAGSLSPRSRLSLKKEGNGPSFICDDVSPSGSSPKGESPQKTFLASYLGLKKPLE